ncbi:MAG: hypothetical protein ACRCX2_22215, partial [Paraclostridium sp.]
SIYPDLHFASSCNSNAWIEHVNLGKKSLIEKKDDVEKTIIQENIGYIAFGDASFTFICVDTENSIFSQEETGLDHPVSMYFNKLDDKGFIGPSSSGMSDFVKGSGALFSYMVRYAFKVFLCIASEVDIEQSSEMNRKPVASPIAPQRR